MRYFPLVRTCQHLEGDVAMSDDCLVIPFGEGEQDFTVLCPLCTKLAREKILSELFTAAVKSSIAAIGQRFIGINDHLE
jgi:hypothetical protein